MEIKETFTYSNWIERKDNGMIKVFIYICDVANPFCCLPSLRDTYWSTMLMLIILLRLY